MANGCWLFDQDSFESEWKVFHLFCSRSTSIVLRCIDFDSRKSCLPGWLWRLETNTPHWFPLGLFPWRKLDFGFVFPCAWLWWGPHLLMGTGGKMLNNNTIVNIGLQLADACWNTYASTQYVWVGGSQSEFLLKPSDVPGLVSGLKASHTSLSTETSQVAAQPVMMNFDSMQSMGSISLMGYMSYARRCWRRTSMRGAQQEIQNTLIGQRVLLQVSINSCRHQQDMLDWLM